MYYFFNATMKRYTNIKQLASGCISVAQAMSVALNANATAHAESVPLSPRTDNWKIAVIMNSVVQPLTHNSPIMSQQFCYEISSLFGSFIFHF